jgi:hypothetical protein
MKKPLCMCRRAVVIVLAWLIPPAGVHAVPAPTELPPLNFGVVKHESKLSQEVTLTNSASHAIRILETRATCPECTKVDLEPQEIPAGKSITFTVRLEPPKDYPEGPVASRILIGRSRPTPPPDPRPRLHHEDRRHESLAVDLRSAAARGLDDRAITKSCES